MATSPPGALVVRHSMQGLTFLADAAADTVYSTYDHSVEEETNNNEDENEREKEKISNIWQRTRLQSIATEALDSVITTLCRFSTLIAPRGLGAKFMKSLSLAQSQRHEEASKKRREEREKERDEEKCNRSNLLHSQPFPALLEIPHLDASVSKQLVESFAGVQTVAVGGTYL